MDEVIVTGEETEDHERELGRAEGAAEVHADQASDQAERAEVAADIAVASVDANMNVAAVAADNADRAVVAAETATFAQDTLIEALSANTAALQSHSEELRLAREAAQTAPKPDQKREAAPKTADKAPARKPRFRDRYNTR